MKIAEGDLKTMRDTTPREGFRTRAFADFSRYATDPDATFPPCRYRAELAGFHVCRAASRVAVVTGTDCGACPVPETLTKVDCFLLRARVRFAPEVAVQWTCGATDEAVEPNSPADCLDCTPQRRH